MGAQGQQLVNILSKGGRRSLIIILGYPLPSSNYTSTLKVEALLNVFSNSKLLLPFNRSLVDLLPSTHTLPLTLSPNGLDYQRNPLVKACKSFMFVNHEKFPALSHNLFSLVKADSHILHC